MTKAQQKRLVNWRLRVLRHERDVTQNISRTCRHFGVSRHVYIRPRTPRLNGKVERSHRADDQEFYQLLDKKGITDDIRLFNAKLREWEDYYNFHRPHGSLSGQTPYERLLEKTKAKRRARLSPRS